MPILWARDGFLVSIFFTIKTKYAATADSLLQQRKGIQHINLVDFKRSGKIFEALKIGTCFRASMVK